MLSRPASLTVALASALLATVAQGQSFTRVIGSGDPAPGSAELLGGFMDPPALDGDHIAFMASHTGQGGAEVTIYSNAGGSFVPVVSTGDPMPTEGVPLEFVLRMAVDGDAVAFQGSSFVGGFARNGIYTNATGALTELVDQNTFIPGGFGTFTQLTGQAHSFGGGVVVFHGSGNSGQRGLYARSASGGPLTVVADAGDAVPGQAPGTTFGSFGRVVVSGDRVVFTGSGFGGTGVYDQHVPGAGALGLVVDTSTLAPDGSALFLTLLGAADEDATLVQSYGTGVGLYHASAGTLTTLADSSTPIPGGSGDFPEFNALAMTAGRAVFEAYDFNLGGHLGVYTDWCGQLTPLIVPGDVIDGLVVQQTLFDEDSVDGDRMVAAISFTDGSQALYLVDLSAMSHYGNGSAGAGQVLPTITGVGCPGLDVDLEVRLRDGPIGGAGFLVVGGAADATPVPGGGQLLARPDVLVPVVLAAPLPGQSGGWFDLVAHVPADPSLQGLSLYVQGALMAPGLPGWALTDGLLATIP